MYCMGYSIRFFHFLNNGSNTGSWNNFSYFNFNTCKEGSTYKEYKIITVVRLIQYQITYKNEYFILSITLTGIIVDNGGSIY
jgi:hypothetical protein